MVTYTCDRCDAVLKDRDDVRGGAHRIIFADVIPWSTNARHGGPPLKQEQIDLCGGCCVALGAWLATKVTRS